MNLYIGKLQNDGVVKYIALPYPDQHPYVPHILKTFYSTEKRVDALLELGNLVTLQPSPYKKWGGCDDKINCRAEIRDDGEKKGKHLPQFADTLDDYNTKLDAHLFLFKEGRWHLNTPDGWEDLATATVTSHGRQDAFRDITLCELSEKGDMCTIDTTQFSGWRDMHDKASAGNKTYFAFRGNKLITTINHPLTPIKA